MRQREPGSVTHWLQRLRGGDREAAHELWTRYFVRIAQFAKRRISARFLRAADEEDVAASVIQSVFKGVAEGRFPLLVDRDELWKLLIGITKQKSANLVRKEMTQKRGKGTVRDEQSLAGGDASRFRLADVLGDWATPDALMIFEEEYQRLLELLDNDLHRKAAMMRIEGYTNTEIAQELNRTERTVERWVEIVRKTWEREVQNGAR